MVGITYGLQFTPCSIGTFVSKATGEVRPAPCGSWNCIDCGPRKARRFLRRISPPQWSYMVTLTLAGSGEPSKENIQSINAHWRVFKRWLERTTKLTDFTWVNEQGKLHSRLHKHALVKCGRISYHAARRAILRAGFGPVCDFKPVRTQRAARFYVSKYLSKSLPVRWPKYSRRCQTSIAAPKSDGSWTLQKTLTSVPSHRLYLPMTEETTRLIIERRQAEFEANGNSWPAQLALIPNTKNCVTQPQQEGLFDGFGHNST